MKRAIYSVGPFTGLRVYAEGDTSRPILHIDPCAHTDLLKLGRDAYGADTLRLLVGGEEYELPARRLAEDILAMLGYVTQDGKK
jgi:hypothetical protein